MPANQMRPGLVHVEPSADIAGGNVPAAKPATAKWPPRPLHSGWLMSSKIPQVKARIRRCGRTCSSCCNIAGTR